MRHPDQIKQYLKEDEFKVYKLIWQRFVASQITPAVFDQTTVDIDAKSGAETFWFRVTGSVLKFTASSKSMKNPRKSRTRKKKSSSTSCRRLNPGRSSRCGN